MAVSGKQPDPKALADKVNALKLELAETRKQSLAASRAGDFSMVARLTTKSAQINRSIFETEGLLYSL